MSERSPPDFNYPDHDADKARRERREHLHDKTRDELVQSQMRNAEQFDRSVLTLSSAFLAISMGFIRDVVIVGDVLHHWMLLTSWVFFALTIITTLFGLLYGQIVLKKLMNGAYRYYILSEKDAIKISEKLPPRITKLNWGVGLLFFTAVLFTVAFVIINSKGAEMVYESKIVETVEVQKEAQEANTFQPVESESQSTSENSNSQQSEQGQDSQASSSGESED